MEVGAAFFERREGAASPPSKSGFAKRQPEKTVLRQVVRENLESLLAQVCAEAPGGVGLPADCGEALVRSAVGQILGAMAGSEHTQGELPWWIDYPKRTTMQRTEASTLGKASSVSGIMPPGGGER